MKNYIQPGDTVTVVAAADTLSGQGVRAGLLFGVASGDALTGQPVEIVTRGVFTLPKATGTAWTVGVALYWNGTACTTAAGTGNLFIGVPLLAQASGDTAGTVRLNGVAPAAQT